MHVESVAIIVDDYTGRVGFFLGVFSCLTPAANSRS